jgi:hypothetical protein
LRGIQDALIGLGVPEEDVDRIVVSLHTLWSAFQDLMDGNVEEFIGKVKAVLLEWGVPIEFIDKMEEAFRWLLETATKVGDYWEETLKPAIKTGWELVFKPALEGLMELLTDLGPLLIAVGLGVLAWIVLPMVLAALPVIALAAAVIALGLIWKEYGDQVKEILGQFLVVITHVFGQAIDWVVGFMETLLGLAGIGDLAEMLGLGELAAGLDAARQKLDDFRDSRIELATSGPDVQSTFGQGNAGLDALLATLGGTQDNRNFTNYGGINLLGGGGEGDPLAALWEMGQ